jgi:hypothetical protein
MKTVIKIQVNTNLQWVVERSPAGHYVATCEPLGLVMEDPSLDGLQASIFESIQLLMVDLLEAQQLDEFLRSRGWRAMPQPQPMAPVSPREVEFDVPYDLLVRTSRDSSRSVLQ